MELGEESMNKGKTIKKLGRYRGQIPRQTLKTIRGQVVAGDLAGANKGLSGEIKKLETRRHEDCFAYKNKNSCTSLKRKNCDNCSFYKTKEEFDEGQRKVLERIRTLDIDQQIHINKSYYEGGLKLEGEI